tara:strand:+ start:636 stop:797 length:162 start_codon:yes stop_codon:yes gene_type:complete
MKNLTKQDLTDAILDLSALIQVAARREGSGKVAEIKALRARRAEFCDELASRA